MDFPDFQYSQPFPRKAINVAQLFETLDPRLPLSLSIMFIHRTKSRSVHGRYEVQYENTGVCICFALRCATVLDLERCGGDVTELEFGIESAPDLPSEELSGGGASADFGAGLSCGASNSHEASDSIEYEPNAELHR